MAGKPSIAIVGPGRLGRALAFALYRAGYAISEVITRDNPASLKRAARLAREVGAKARSVESAALNARVIWLCVPDQEIARAVRDLAGRTSWKRKIAFHSSGALSSRHLASLSRRGAASVHPLMTFVGGAIPSLRGVPFAVEGNASAVRVARGIVRSLGGESFSIRAKDKPMYHAWATFACPLLIAALATAEQVASGAGVPAAVARRRMLPIVRQTIANYGALGPARAFSGPLVRGDAGTVRAHLQALRRLPEAQVVYRALAGAALARLPVRNRRQLAEILKEPRGGKT